jgi:hypothetical protein
MRHGKPSEREKGSRILTILLAVSAVFAFCAAGSRILGTHGHPQSATMESHPAAIKARPDPNYSPRPARAVISQETGWREMPVIEKFGTTNSLPTTVSAAKWPRLLAYSQGRGIQFSRMSVESK